MARLGQHFLTDKGALDDIVRASGVEAGELTLEIGPGRGALTKPLLAASAPVANAKAVRSKWLMAPPPNYPTRQRTKNATPNPPPKNAAAASPC